MGVVGFATHGFRSVTGIERHLTRVLRSATLTGMLILDRDRQIVLSVARFQQLTAGHVRAIHFEGHASNTPVDRALKRLVEGRYLARIERRMIGGTGAGSGQYVYQLGRNGWTLAGREGKYWPFRAVNYHTLAIADTYVEMLRWQQLGRIIVLGFHTEPDSWRKAGGEDLRPDLYVQIADRLNGRELSLWVEVDLGTERLSVIRHKLASYWRAYQHAGDSMEIFPQVLFLAPDDDRAKHLRWTIEQGDQEAQELFMVSTVDQFGGLYFS